MKGEVILKTESFDREFARVVNQAAPQLAADGLFQWGLKLIQYAIMEPPRAPHKTGTLWDSQFVEKPVIEPGRILVRAGFTAEYAAAVHEMVVVHEPWTLRDSGPKFLESKVSKHGQEMPAFVANYIKEHAK